MRRAARDVLVSEPLCRVDYLALVHPDHARRRPGVVLAARRCWRWRPASGSTRLIDNVPLTLGAQTTGAAR